MLISVLCPSRGRDRLLEQSIRSILDTADNIDNIEILVRKDSNDPCLVPDYVTRYAQVSVGPPFGYSGMATYYGELAHKATGKWLFVWNDDAIMTTPGWDSVVESYGNEFCLIAPRNNHSACLQPWFPIFPHKFYEFFGWFSRTLHCDSYIYDVFRLGELPVYDEIRIFVQHNRADITGLNNDATFKARIYDTAHHEGPEMQGIISQDAAWLKEWLGK